jgi:hypothetical protein
VTEGNSKFLERVAERRRLKEEAERKAAIQQPTFDSDLIPQSDRSEEDQELDRFIESIDIIDAYRRWCGKSTVDTQRRRTEGIKISCPKPSHPDKDPSAWINTDKQVWFCGGCQEGGDVYDIAAYHFGYPVPGYKDGEQFHHLRKEMAESYGYSFIRPPGSKTEILVGPEPDESSPALDKKEQTVSPADKSDIPPASLESSTEPAGEATVINLFDEDDVDEDITFPRLDWQAIIPEDTFLDAYMKATSIDDVPEEYHFWHALVGLGFALGRDVTLEDFIPVHGNLFVCTLGHSGAGKSKAMRHLNQLLATALPHKWDDPGSKGVRRISAPGSAEVLIHNFSKPVVDPTDMKRIAYYAPVRGLVDFNELSALVARTNRQGNATKPTLMQLYDMDPLVATSSMTHGSKEAHEPFTSAITSTQPRAIRTLLTRGDADSGFLNRWVFAAGPPKQKFAIGGVRIDLGKPVDSLLDVFGWTGSFASDERIQWSVAAAELFTKFFHTTIEPEKNRDESGLLIRMDLLMKKLILLFTANQKLKIVPVDAVQSAISMWPYIIECYAVPSGQIGNTLQHEVREEITRHAQRFLEKNGTGITMRDLNLRLKRKKYPLDLVAKTLKYMCDLGELEMSTNKGSMGRPTVRYKYVG